jgi:hypothetical protein
VIFDFPVSNNVMNIQNFQLGMTLAPHKDPEIMCGNRSLKEYTTFVSVFFSALYTNMAAYAEVLLCYQSGSSN